MSKKSKKAAPGESGKSGKYSPNIVNKKARFNYHILEKLEAGMVLVGTEVKSLRAGKASLDEAYARILDDELFLLGCTIPIYEHGNLLNHEPNRKRKLLVHRRELHKLATRMNQKGLTLVPLRIYFVRGLAKVEIGIAQGKTFADKRSKLRDREVERDINRAQRRRV